MCKGRAKVINDAVEVTKEHVCAIDPSRVQAEVAKCNIRERASTTQDTARSIVMNCTMTLNEEAKLKLSKYNSIQRTIERVRKREQLPYPTPQTLAEIQIPDPLSVTKTGQQFLFHDSGADDPERFFIFTTEANRQMLQDYHVWSVDGTFKVAPQLFYQLWTVHALVHNAVLPLVYILMTGKTQALYERVLTALCQNRNFNPSFIILDFEKACMNALQVQFPNATLHGCFFHLCQSIWRKVQEFGLQERYMAEEEFRQAVKIVGALAFVPVDDVTRSFELLQENYQDDEDAQRIFDYFESVYIGKLRRNRRANPLFALDVWNCYDAVVDQLPRTNNNIEGWHRAFQGTLGLVHPNIYRLVDAMINEQGLMEFKKARAISGERIPLYSKRRYALVDARLRQLIETYADRQRIDYLRACSYNFDF